MQEQWGIFCERVIPTDAPEVQKTEMRRAFYAGGEAILFRIIAAFAPETTEPTKEDLQIMDDLDAELKAFAADVAAGRA
jgi:hypothetical protein